MLAMSWWCKKVLKILGGRDIVNNCEWEMLKNFLKVFYFDLKNLTNQ